MEAQNERHEDLLLQSLSSAGYRYEKEEFLGGDIAGSQES